MNFKGQNGSATNNFKQTVELVTKRDVWRYISIESDTKSARPKYLDS